MRKGKPVATATKKFTPRVTFEKIKNGWIQNTDRPPARDGSWQEPEKKYIEKLPPGIKM